MYIFIYCLVNVMFLNQPLAATHNTDDSSSFVNMGPFWAPAFAFLDYTYYWLDYTLTIHSAVTTATLCHGRLSPLSPETSSLPAFFLSPYSLFSPYFPVSFPQPFPKVRVRGFGSKKCISKPAERMLIEFFLLAFLWKAEKCPPHFYVRVTCSLRVLVSVVHWHSARWAWNGYQPGLGSIPRPGRINSFTITGVHALRLISRTGKRVLTVSSIICDR